MTTVTEKTYSEYCESDVARTLRAKGGNVGGGSEVLVIEESINESDST